MSEESAPTPSTVRSVGRYLLYDEIASGGMASIHLGRLAGEGGFKRTVAVKRMHAHYAKDKEFVGMFIDEARVAARVQHPNVVATLDVLRLGDELFQVMEYVHGASLSRLLKLCRAEDELMPLPIVGAIVSGLLFGLHAAHEALDEKGAPLHIIHRDVSPHNVLVGSDGVSRVLDFGVAKAAVQAQATKSGQVKGKLAYMPPEQLLGEEMDRRADIYSAGIVLWECLCGRRMRKASSEGAMYGQIVEGVITPPSEHNDQVTPEIDAIVLKALSSRPADRYATAHDMADEVESVIGTTSARAVSAFVKSTAEKVLTPLATKVHEMESDMSSIQRELASPVAEDSTRIVGDVSVQDKTFATSAVHERPGSRRNLIWGVAVVAALAAGLFLREVFSEPAVAPSATPASTPAAPPVEAPAPSQPPATSATAEPATTASAAASAVLSANASASAVAAQPPRRWRPKPTPPKPTAKPAVTAAPNCNPPYYITKEGARRYKMECL